MHAPWIAFDTHTHTHTKHFWTDQHVGFTPLQVQRCFTVLKTRHTAPGSWRSGKQLFEAVLALPRLLPEQRSKVEGWVKDSKAMLGDEDIPSASASTSAQPGGGEAGRQEVPEEVQELRDLLTLVRQVCDAPPLCHAVSCCVDPSQTGV